MYKIFYVTCVSSFNAVLSTEEWVASWLLHRSDACCKLDTLYFMHCLNSDVVATSVNCRTFAGRIQRPFGVRYNPYTQSIEVLSNSQKIAALVSELRGDLCIVSNALRKIHEHDETVDVEGITSLLHSGIHLKEEMTGTEKH